MELPTLTEMGINNPAEIARYTLRQKGPRRDVLKIHYHRQKGSLRPVSRTYEFGRSQTTVISDSGAPEYENEHDPSPILQAAIGELDELLRSKQPELKVQLENELESLKLLMKSAPANDQISTRLASLESIISKL